MTDRELLELAAKAAGLIIVDEDDDLTLYVISQHDKKNGDECGERWAPLEDDGDALRLAVSLVFKVEPGRCWYSHYGPAFGEDLLGGEMKATRRAIVRAAAAIGRAMP